MIGVAGRLSARVERRRGLENGDGLLQLGVLPLQHLELARELEAFATATWVWKSGSPGPTVPMHKGCGNQTGDVDLPHAVGAGPGKQGVLLDEPQRIPDRRVMRDLDR